MAKTTVRPIRLGTRGSKLALVQSRWVASQLESLGWEVTLEIIRTAGDQQTDAPLHQIGGQGLFVSEIEGALRHGPRHYARASALGGYDAPLSAHLPDHGDHFGFGRGKRNRVRGPHAPGLITQVVFVLLAPGLNQVSRHWRLFQVGFRAWVM